MTKLARKSARSKENRAPISRVYHRHLGQRRAGIALDPQRGCWIWLGATTGSGYGKVYERAPERYGRAAHRVYWEDLHGPIPEGMQLDHLCERRLCVNPGHMRVVTPDENKHAYWRRRRAERAERIAQESSGLSAEEAP